MTARNLILIICLALFLFGYVSYFWAYQVLYREPRQRLGNEIDKLSKAIEVGKNNYAEMSQFSAQRLGFYARSLPLISNDAQSLYSFWLLELLQYSGMEGNYVNNHSPFGLPLGADYRFSIQCTGSLSQLSNFLFEFYYAPFLHRIVSLTLTPVEGNPGRQSFTMTVSALQLRQRQQSDLYPMMNQLPAGWHIQRLTTNDLGTYKVISDRNLLQTAKGGIDRADFAVLTAILPKGNQKEIWFTILTDDSRIEAKVGDSIHIGSFSGKVVEILDQDIVLERNGERWLLSSGESLNEAFALPLETSIQL